MLVGNFSKIDPAFLIEEELDFLIIGEDIENGSIPSQEIQVWLFKFIELYTEKQFTIKSISRYVINSTEINVNHYWDKFIRNNKFCLTIFPPVLHLKIKKGGFSLEKNAYKLVKEYCNKFIDYFLIF